MTAETFAACTASADEIADERLNEVAGGKVATVVETVNHTPGFRTEAEIRVVAPIVALRF